MANRKNFSRYNMRCGILLHAKAGAERISELKLPDLDARYLALTGSDLPGSNEIEFFGRTMPLIAKETISFQDQILLVLRCSHAGMIRVDNEHSANRILGEVDRLVRGQDCMLLTQSTVPTSTNPHFAT